MGEIFRFESIICRIWSNDHDPAHVEVFWPSMKNPEGHAKFLIDDLECFFSRGFSERDLKKIKKQLKLRHKKIIEHWREIHG